jgi:His-Xaa-Ser repeat protein HxsA
MKAYALLAALTLAVPADSLADRRHGHSGGSHHRSHHSGHSHRHSYHSHRHYPSYSRSWGYARPSYYSYRPSYYSYQPYYYSSYGYAPAVSFSYTSVPRTYYRSAPDYDDGSSLEADVQRALKRRGYYAGSIDGDIGPASRAAIREYQSERGLERTGRIDAALLRSLGL